MSQKRLLRKPPGRGVALIVKAAAKGRPQGPGAHWKVGEDEYWALELARRCRPLALWIVRTSASRPWQWRELSEEGSQPRPYHLEIAHGREGARDEYLLRSVKQVFATGKPVLGRLFGVCDHFHPLAGRLEDGSLLYAGQFLEARPDLGEVRRRWKELSGREAGEGDPAFSAYCRTLARLPVLDAKAREALEAVLELWAALLRRDPRLEAKRERALRLARTGLLPGLPPQEWVERALGADPLRPTPWHFEKGVAPWMQEEVGITRLPTVVLACAPQLEAPLGEAESLMLSRQLANALLAFARTQREVVAGALEEHAALLLAHPLASGSLGRRRLEELAEAARRWAKAELGLRLRVGVGGAVPEGERLYPSYQEALLALHTAVLKDKAVLFYEDQPRGPGALWRLPRLALMELRLALEGGRGEALELAIQNYERRVLEAGEGRLDLVRGHLQAALSELASAVQPFAEAASWRSLEAGLAGPLGAAGAMAHLLEAFHQAVGALAGALERRGRQGAQLAAALEQLRQELQSSLRLGAVARRFGYSVPAFTRAFRRQTGLSFLQWLNQERADKAAVLLRTTGLSVEQVAARSGFSSSHHLIRAFKKRFHQTPRAYRLQAQIQGREGGL